MFYYKGLVPQTGRDRVGLEWKLSREQNPAEEGAESSPARNAVTSVTDFGASSSTSEPGENSRSKFSS